MLWQNTITFAWVVGIGLVIMIGVFIYIAVTKLTLKDNVDETSGQIKDASLEGAMGVTLSDLRPSGMAMINDERIEVYSEGNYIKQNSPIKVKRIDGSKILVEEVGGSW